MMIWGHKIKDVEVDTEGDVDKACLCFLDELAKGPFNPCLSRELLARFRVSAKLGDFLREHLANKVVLVGNVGNPTPSPVGQPAVALVAKLNDPAYWANYRRSSLWEEPTMVHEPFGGGVRKGADDAAFKRLFPVGARFRGTVSRQSFKGAGVLVELDGRDRPCLLPTENIPAEFRTRIEDLVGVGGEFEVASVLPSAKSVWVKVVRLFPLTTATGKSSDADIERRLMLIQALHAKGLLTQNEFDEKRRRILAEL